MSVIERRIVSEIATRHGLSARGDWSTSIRDMLYELNPGTSVDDANHLDSATVDRFASNLTISETFFMRHHTQLVFAAQHLAQRLSEGASAVRVLSAGCSTGEEPYSLVLCLMRLLGDYIPSQVDILGCDLSQKAIEKAIAGEYGNWSFRGVPPWLLKQHFEVVKEGVYRLCPQVRRRVELRHASITDVLKGYPDGSLDLVMFRNVGIYLESDYLAGLYDQFRRVLRSDGALVVAPSDPRPSGAQFRRTPHDSTSVYWPATHCAAAPSVASEHPHRRREDIPPSVPPVRIQAAMAPAQEPPHLPEPAAIREMADGGDMERALELAVQFAARCPTDPEAHVLLGQLHMAGVRSDDRRCAIESLRRAVFIAPEHPPARFWYANALLADGHGKKAQRQLDTLSVLLAKLPDDQCLGDDEMTVSQLRDAKAFLLEGLS